MRRGGAARRLAWPLALATGAAAQQFEIPAEMLQGMFGGGMGGGQRRIEATTWPKSENSEVEPAFEWLVNTEWEGKTAKYLLLRDGIVESNLKECEHEGMCLWAANSGRMLINTPTLKVVRFKIEGVDTVEKKKLENKDETALKAIKMIAEKANNQGKKSVLHFSRIAVADDSENVVAKDLYALLGIKEDEPQGSLKSKFRRLSVEHHPDKGGDVNVFNEIREAYEILGDVDTRRYYDLGGMQLVKNIETAWKEVEGQKAQLDAQLSKVPKNHPQYKQFEAQIEQQKAQFEKSRMKSEIEKKVSSEEREVLVPVSAQNLYTGVSKFSFEWRRLVICRGCRAEPDRPDCLECGRCPPEKVQVPQYANTPFGRQVVAIKEKEQESRERCREVNVKIDDLRVPKGAKEGSTLKYVSDVGHQTPGKLPGRIVLKVQRGSPTDTYEIAESDLHTVLHISLEQAIFGFSESFVHLGDETVAITRDRVVVPDEVVRFRKKGLVGDGGVRGDLYVRLAVDLPGFVKGRQALTLKAPEAKEGQARLEREDPVELREGAAWRRWRARETPIAAKGKKGKDGKEEL